MSGLMGTGDTRGLMRQSLACLVGLAIGGAAFALVADPYRILAAAVLGLAGTLALWPLSRDGEQAVVKREFRIFGRRRLRELETQVERLTAELERGRVHRGQIVGALRSLDDWAATQEPEPRATVTDISSEPAEGRGGATWRVASTSSMQRRGRL
jgi:hypothetical protein